MNDSTWDQHDTTLEAPAGEQVGRAGDDTSGLGHRELLLDQRSASPGEGDDDLAIFATDFLQGSKF